MYLENEPALANDLERGLGQVRWTAVAYDASLRLRLPMCDITSIALTEAFRSAGYDADPIISSPKGFIAEPDSQHVFVSVDTEQGKYIVDPTYSQFLDKTGLSPGYVLFGGEDLYPERKIAVFKYDEGDQVATALADATMHFRDNREILDEHMGVYTMENMTHTEIAEEFNKIWNPANFDAFIPAEPEVREVGARLARFILPEHVKLVA